VPAGEVDVADKPVAEGDAELVIADDLDSDDWDELIHDGHSNEVNRSGSMTFVGGEQGGDLPPSAVQGPSTKREEPLPAHTLTAVRLGTIDSPAGKKNVSPRACAHCDSSSPPAINSSWTFSMLKTTFLEFFSMTQSQKAGQKSKP
jgi:hypothetical protein